MYYAPYSSMVGFKSMKPARRFSSYWESWLKFYPRLFGFATGKNNTAKIFQTSSDSSSEDSIKIHLSPIVLTIIVPMPLWTSMHGYFNHVSAKVKTNVTPVLKLSHISLSVSMHLTLCFRSSLTSPMTEIHLSPIVDTSTLLLYSRSLYSCCTHAVVDIQALLF